MRKTLTLSFLFLVIAFLTQTALACSCDYFPKHRKDFRDAEAVFVGQVLAVDKSKLKSSKLEKETIEARLRVEKRWKGAKQSEVLVYLSDDSIPCGWRFRAGEKYLSYAYYDYKDESRLVIRTFCSRSRPIETNDADRLKEFKQLDSFWFRFFAGIPYI